MAATAAVDVLLATYNGEKYIREQLDSILGQSFRDFRIVARDDGSTDATPEILKEYERRCPGVVEVVSDGAVCGSAASNFFQLLKYARAPYVMFADQDDYWLPEKIELTLTEMRELEEKGGACRPALVFADSEAVDAALNPLPPDKKNAPPRGERENLTLSRLLVENVAAGCLMMVNRALYAAMGVYAEGIAMHDWWAALCASAWGAILHVPRTVMLYRQHGDNCVGTRNMRSISYRLGKFLDPQTRLIQRGYLRQALLFRERYASRLSEKALKTLDDFIALYGMRSKLARMRALIRGGYLKGDWAKRLGQLFYI